MIAPASTTTSTRQVLPSLELDFTTGNLDSRVTVARLLNTATRVNSSGYIELINANLPRFDYDPVTRACKGLLIEESRSNLILSSQQFSGWPLTNLSSSDDFAISPEGVQNADLLIPTVTNAAHRASQFVTVSSGTTYAASIYVKASDYKKISIRDGVGSGAYASFDLSNGTILDQAFGIGRIEPAGAGFYRCILTFTAAGSARIDIIVLPDSYVSGVPVAFPYPGNGTSGIIVYGGQFETGASATSYIPTVASAVTRNADVATITGTNFSDWWQVGKGSALVCARPSTVSGTRPLVQFDDTTADNIIALRGNTTNPELYVRTGGSDQVQIDAGTIAANTSYRLAGSWAENSCAASINSGTPVLDGVATIPVVTQSRLGSDGTNYLNGHLEAVEYYDERVLDASLQVVSSTAGYRSIIGPVFRDAIIS